MDLKQTHKYKSYDDYVKFQLIKTSDKERQKKWLGKEWELKINIFKNLFTHNLEIIQNCEKCLCLGSRTGQEVVAFKELGIDNTIGIDLHEFPPYTIKGDIHDIDFPDESFDIEFTNIFDHSLYPIKFIQEIYRTLTNGGYLILHIQLGVNQDSFTETIIENENAIEKLVLNNNFKLISKRKIDSGIIAMNHEFVFQK